ncbi:DUF4179 domain-containing protein [Sedimentibacter saalensis]|uniref:Uncharacterized protein DUF4179 n=1 Tax=Sedimentibacter saalensis TaxID=130788 RepID=A0A562JBX0_9FIRM|nr:DUF4179 domain-containing protein [Sedimentibacter saalensis]TWH80721.1 uncharacterized protein DUF4179 [Sedimentibacter saalensis]
MEDKNMNNLIEESFEYPEELSHVERRLEMRILKEKRKKRALVSFISSVAAAAMFIVLVNTSTAFAGIVAEIPLIGSIAEYVKFDSSLKSAIENDYIQQTNLIAYDGSEKLMLPYVIADEKNLVLFFKLPDDFELTEGQWAGISLTSMENGSSGKKIEGFGYSSSNISWEENKSKGLIMQQYNFSEGFLPHSIKINVSLKRKTYQEFENQFLEDEKYPLMEDVGNFSFNIEFNEFAKPIEYEFNQEHIIMGQKITLKEMKVYPTGTEVSFEFSEENSAWIKGLDLAVESEGTQMYSGRNGITSTYDETNSHMNVYIQSDYFAEPKEQNLIIKGIRLLEKDKEFITVDLEKGIISPEIEGMRLSKVSRRGEKADLTFSTNVSDDECFGVFAPNYKDSEGKSYEIKSEGSSRRDSEMETYLTVEYPESGVVILQRSLTPKIFLKEPIKIPLPIK